MISLLRYSRFEFPQKGTGDEQHGSMPINARTNFPGKINSPQCLPGKVPSHYLIRLLIKEARIV